MSKTVSVGISDFNVVAPPDVLVTYALGSCVGICLYDTKTNIAGLLHIMLPSSEGVTGAMENRKKFADTGIPDMLTAMERRGAMRARLVAKIAGGAQMFATNTAVFNIGERNVAAVKKVLEGYRIPILAQDVGKNYGRTVFFSAVTGKMEVRAATKETLFL